MASLGPSVFFHDGPRLVALILSPSCGLVVGHAVAALKPEMRPSPFHHLSKHLPSKQIPLKTDHISANVFSEGGTVQCLCSEKFP